MMLVLIAWFIDHLDVKLNCLWAAILKPFIKRIGRHWERDNNNYNVLCMYACMCVVIPQFYIILTLFIYLTIYLGEDQ